MDRLVDGIERDAGTMLDPELQELVDDSATPHGERNVYVVRAGNVARAELARRARMEAE